MHANIDELIHVHLEGPWQVLYIMLWEALYRTLQAALLFWENLSNFLTIELGFMVTPMTDVLSTR
jgi:hypothetical protein